MDTQVSSVSVSTEDVMDYIRQSLEVPNIARAIARRRLMAQAAQEEGLVVTPEELQKAADQLRAQQELWGQKETMDWLSKYALTLDDFENIARFAVLTEKLAYHLFKKQVEPHFLAHQKDYTSVVFYEVVLDDADLALELFYALEEGEISFGEVAEEYASDPEVRYKGGYRGKKRCRDLLPAIATAVFAVKGKTLLKPISVGREYHLILVVEKIKPKLSRRLKREILFELFEDWVERQLKTVSIDLELM